MLPNLVSACNGLGGLIPPQPHTIQQLTPLALFTLKPIVLLEDFLSGEKFTNPFIKYLCHCFPHRALKNIILHVTLNLFLHHNLYKYVFYVGRPYFVIYILGFMCHLIQISHMVR